MEDSSYNGLIEYSSWVIVKSSNHRTCLAITKRIKDYLSAWSFGCHSQREAKSARKGDVLKRDVMVHFMGYPSEVIIFSEGLRCICYHYNLYVDETTVEIFNPKTLPKGSRKNILNTT